MDQFSREKVKRHESHWFIWTNIFSDSCNVNNGGCNSNATCSHDSTTYACTCTCKTGFVNTGSATNVVCSLAPGNVIGYVKSSHINSTNPGFSVGSCPVSPNGYAYGWHFIIADQTSTFVAINCIFKQAGLVTNMIQTPTTKHAYVFTETPDTLLSTWAVIRGSLTTFPLSHVCAPSS